MQISETDKSINAGKFQSKGMNGFSIKELIGEENIDWVSIKKNFTSNPDQFEELLFKVHYKRNKTLPAEKRSRILNFLSTGYLSTNDIRYFNEFLWFYSEKNSDKHLIEDCVQKFNSNLDEKGFHRIPEQLKEYSLNTTGYELNKIGHENKSPLRVCLIGFPPFFGTIIKRLQKDGHHVEQFFLPYHPNQFINLILKLKVPVKVLSFLSGNIYSYRTLNFDYKDEKIGQILREGNFDIGFHKLNFIIKSNVFNAFRKGLLNDHWGYLPLLRGKSTIAYSVLLNIPVIPTIHFINEGIDSGPIAGYYPYDYSKAGSVKNIRDMLRKKMPERVVAAIKYACSTGFIPKENKKEEGITCYEIHPWLNDHIASRIFKQ